MGVEERIIDILSKHPEGLTITNISKELGIHRNTTSKYIFALAKAGIIEQRRIGKVALCSLKKQKKGFIIGKKSIAKLSLAFLALIIVLIFLFHYTIPIKGSVDKIFNFTELNGYRLEIELEKQKFFTNELIKISGFFGLANKTPLENQSLSLTLISPDDINNQIISTDLNGSFSLPLNLNQGNYTIIASSRELETSLSIEVLEIPFSLTLEKNIFATNETVSIFIQGEANKEFTLEIFGQESIENFTLVTNEKGEYVFKKNFSPGNYTAKILSSEVSFEVLEERKEIKLELISKEFYYLDENISLIVNGTQDQNFDLSILKEGLSVFSFSGQTNASGLAEIFFKPFEKGNYSARLSCDEKESLVNFEILERLNETFYGNITQNVSLVVVSIEQGKAEINKPVKWKKVLRAFNPSEKEVEIDFELELPENSFNANIEEKQGKKIEKMEGKVLKDRLKAKESKEYVLTYYTEAPYAYEKVLNKYRKIIRINSSLHYENVLAYAEIEKAPRNSIRLYWLVDSERIDVTFNESFKVKLLDLDNDELIERVEWIIPYLSEQVFEISIVILNPYTYLRDGENWIVAFNTTGKEDLIISSPNANWKEMLKDKEETFDEMEFIDIKCGENSLKSSLQLIDEINNTYDYSQLTEEDLIRVKKFLIKDYSCDETGYFINKMFRAGYAILEFDFAGQKAYAFDPPACDYFISSCQELNQTNTYYCLNQSVSNESTCFNIKADNITLDCQGYTINYSQSTTGYAINNSLGYDNITIKNCNIFQGDSTPSYSYAIYGSGMNNSYIYNNTITTSGSSGYGIYLYSSSNNNILSNNNITTSGSFGLGIYLSSSSNNNILSNNNITTSNSSGLGIYLYSSSNNNITNNTISTSGSDGYGILLYSSSNNSITNNNIITSSSTSAHAIYIYSSSSNNITGGSYIALGGGNSYDYFLRNASTNNNFTQTNFTASRRIYFYDTTSWFNYNNRTDIELWLKTNVSSSATITRKLISWTRSLIQWNDTNSSGTDITARYNITGLNPNKYYLVYNNSVLTYTLQADSYGNLPSFTIYLSSEHEIKVQEDTPPQYSLNSTNSTLAGTAVEHRLNWTDNIGLSHAIFSFDNCTGEFQNISEMSLSGTEAWSNFTVIINSTIGCEIRWKVYANDTSNNWNESEIFSYTTRHAYCDYFISSCQELNQPNTYYCLNQSVSSSATCFNIKADNITLDCQAYLINYSQSSTGYAINNTDGYDNITIKNCNIFQGDSTPSYSYAIYGSGMNNSYIYNNTITTSGSTGYGILLYSSSNNSITNNSITTSNTYGFGIYLPSSSNNNITNNNITTSGSSGYGIYLYSSSNNSITNNSITTSNTYGYGIYLDSSSNNSITNNSITTSNSFGYGIHLSSSSNNNITNNNIITSSSTSAHAIYIYSSSSNIITGGSYIALGGGSSYDYYLRDASTTNNFTQTNFTAPRTISFYDTTSWFNYNNRTDIELWLKTNVSSSATITRKLISWTQSLMQWNDTNSSGTDITARYNITGLSPDKNYLIYNNSVLTYTLQTDSSGNLPSFTIYLGSEHEIKVQEDTPPQYSLNSTNSTLAGTAVSHNLKWTDNVGLSGYIFSFDNCTGTFVNDSFVYWGETEHTSIDWSNKLIGLYHLNEGSGTSTGDSSSNNWNGTLTGNPIWTGGKFSNAIFINETGIRQKYINVTTSTGAVPQYPINNFTVALWAKFNNSNQNFIATGAGGQVGFIFAYSNTIIPCSAGQFKMTKYGVTDICITPSPAFTPDYNWHHFVGIWNSSGVFLYIDGDLRGSNTNTNNLLQNTYNPIIGSAYSDTATYNLTIEEIAIWNRSLSETEIKKLYNQIEAWSNVTKVINSTVGCTIRWKVYANDTSNNWNESETFSYTTRHAYCDVFISSCQELNQPNTYYCLNQSVSSSATCFNIKADNITLDCQAYLINYSQSSTGYAINNTDGYDNITIKNCNIFQGNSTPSYSYAIYGSGMNNSYIYNNTITTSGSSGFGIYLPSSSNNSITNNSITTSNTYGFGIYLPSISTHNILTNNNITTSNTYGFGILLSSSSNNNITNNNIKTSNSTGYGIYLSSSSNNNILSNNTITTSGSSGFGIYLSSSSNNNILTNNNITTSGSYGYGILLESSPNNNITNNNITTSGSYGYGILLESSSNNNITNNNITTSGSSGFGIYLYSSSNNTLTNNRMNTSQTNSLVVYGTSSSHFNHSIDNSNLAEGLPIYYCFNCSNTVIENQDYSNTYGQIIFAWSTNVTINNITASNDGFNFFNVTYSKIINSIINTSKGYGIFLYSSSAYNNIYNNNITTSSSSGFGIRLSSSSNNNILSNNTITTSGSYGYGILLESSSNNNITNNNITTSNTYGYGIYLSSSSNNNILSNNNIITSSGSYGYGIYLYSSPNNNITNNNITTSNTYGYGIYLYSSSNNNITNNNITTSGSSGYGIRLSSSSNNNILTNNNITTSGSSGFGIYLSSSSNNNILTNNNITTSGSSGYGIRLSSSSNNNILTNNNITTSGSSGYGILLESSSNNNILSNNNVITSSSTSAHAIYIYSSSSNNITGGSYIAKGGGDSYDYYLYSAGSTNNFTNTNFTASRRIYFYDTTSWFNYNNRTDIELWLKTNVSSSATITRKLISWTQSLMQWNDTNSSGTEITARYNITGLNPNKYYLVYNNSVLAYTLKTDSSGSLPSFTIYLSGESEIKVQEDTQSPQIQFIPPTDPNAYHANRNWSYVNVSITDDLNTSAFIDWNYSLVGYWSFDWYNSTGIYDNSTYNNFCSFKNGTGTDNITSGKYGNALSFDGIDDYVDCGNDSSLRLTFWTVEAWVKFNDIDTTTGDIFVSKGYYCYNYKLDTSGDGKLRVWAGCDALADTENYTTGIWYHVVGTYDNSTLKLYVNGTLKNSISLPGVDFTPYATYPVILGDFMYEAGYELNGSLDEVRIWNRVLSEEEIKASYNSGLYRLYRNFTNLTEGTYQYYAYAIDSNGNSNKTETRTLSVDLTAPQYCCNSTNNTIAGLPTLFSLKWIDNFGLSGYIFSTNNSGAWMNDTWVSFVSGGWGNNFGFTTRDYYQLDTASKKVSYRFTAPETKIVDKVRFNFITGGTPPIYNVSIQGDLNGIPNGTILGSALFSQNASSWTWANVDISDVPLTAGEVYHLVIQYQSGTINSSNYMRVKYILGYDTRVPYDLSSNTGFNFLSNSGTGWIIGNRTPIFILNYTDNTIFGQPYDEVSSHPLYGVRYFGEEFYVPEDITIQGFEFYVAKTGNPSTLFMVLYDKNASNVVFNETITETIGTSYTRVKHKLDKLITLEKGKYYQFFGQSPGSNSSNYYGIMYHDCGDGFTGTTWDGLRSNYASTTTGTIPLSKSTFSRDLFYFFIFGTNQSWSNVTKIANSTVGTTVSWRVYANDTANNWNISEIFELTTTDIPPFYSLNSTNSTIAGSAVSHNLFWQDNIGLSYAIFSFDNCTGEFQNITEMSLSGTQAWSNFTVTINETIGCTIRWKVYANDSNNNWNESEVFSYTTTSPSPCQVYINASSQLPYTISQSNTYYCLNSSSQQNFAGTAITFASGVQNSTLDCQGFTLDGDDSNNYNGIYISGSDTKNNTVKNCNITDFGHAISLYYATNISIVNNILSSSPNEIVVLCSAHNNTLENNTISYGSNDGVWFVSANNNTLKNNIVFNNWHGFCDSGNSNIFINNTVMNNNVGFNLVNLADNYLENNTVINNNYGIVVSRNGNKIIGGSVHGSTSADYSIGGSILTTNFTQTNFTSARTIYFADTTSWFNYNNRTDLELWLQTSVSQAATITRKLISWTQSLMQWNDTNSSGTDITARYNITGLNPNKYYLVYNNSVLTYTLQADSSGNLPSFTIYLLGESEIKVQEEEAPQYSNNKTFPTSPTTYDQAKTYQFNITCTDNSGITNAWLNFNGTIYQMNNQSNEYYTTLADLPAGSYYYNFTCNDTFGITNTTDTLLYTIEKAKPVLTISNSSYSVNTSGLVGYWRFEEGSGIIAKDSSGYGNDGTLYNNPSWKEGMFGNALSFNSTNYVEIQNSSIFNVTEEMSVEAWIYAEQQQPTQSNQIVQRLDWANYKGFFLREGYNSDHKVSFYVANGTNWVYVSYQVPPEKWYHILGSVKANDKIKLYVNGSLVAEYPFVGSIVQETNKNITIAYEFSGSSFNGTIDEVRIWNRSLNNDEVRMLYQSKVTYKTQTNFSCFSNTQQVTPSLYRNTTLVSNPDIQNLTAGYYYYLCNASETQNYTQSAILSPLKVNPGSLSLTLSPELTKGIFYTNLTGSMLNIQFNVDINAWNNATWNYNATDKKTEYWIRNDGTYEVDICQKASSNMLCYDECANPSYEIYIGNVSWSNSTFNNATHPSFSTLYPLTLDYSQNKSAYSLAPGQYLYLRFWLFVPPYVPSGKYNTSIIFNAVEAGNPC